MRHRVAGSALALVAVISLSLSTVTPAAASEFTTDYHSPTTAGDTVYFAGKNGDQGVELFKTDGTKEGTVLVKDVCTGWCSAFTDEFTYPPSDRSPEFTTIGELTYFVANDAALGAQLWVTDGTTEGTRRLTSERAASGWAGAAPRDLVAHNGDLYFSAVHETLRRELWKTDGTVEGTTVYDLKPGAGNSFPADLVESGGSLYFFSKSTAAAGTVDLWKVVGDNAPAVVQVITTSTNGEPQHAVGLGDGRIAIQSVRGSTYSIVVTDQTGTTSDPWQVDPRYVHIMGVVDDQLVVFDIEDDVYRISGPDSGMIPVAPGGYDNFRDVTIEGNTLWYFVRGALEGAPLYSIASWDSEPVLAGIVPKVGTDHVIASDYSDGTLWFWQYGSIWKTDGSADSVVKVKDVGLYRKDNRWPGIAAANGFAVATARDVRGDAYVWLTNGTADGTRRVLPLLSFTTTPNPTVIGAMTVGTKLAARVGTWGPETPTFSYQWLASDVPIAGATSKYFTLTADQRGKYVTVQVTATREGYFPSIRDSFTYLSVKSTFTKAPTPTISGTVVVGKTLTAASGFWTGTPKLSYRWYADGVALRGAISKTYTIPSSMVGKKLSVKVTATKDGYVTTSRTSAATTAVRAA